MNRFVLGIVSALYLLTVWESKAQEILQQEDLIAILDTIWITEQEPIGARDSLIDIYGVDAKEVEFYQKLYEINMKSTKRK